MTPLDTPRILRERSKMGPAYSGARHSPDGYFAHDDAFLRNWRPSTGLASTAAPTSTGVPPNFNVRRRSKGHLVGLPGADGEVLQDVQEEDGCAAGANAVPPWRRPSRHDLRSPCPALNTAANHGYLPRDGRDISIWTMITGLRACYNVSWVLAILFTVGSFIIIRLSGVGRGWLWPRVDLDELAAHNVLEHNASLTHADHAESGLQSPCPGTRSRSSSSASSTVMSSTTNLPNTPHLPFPFSLLAPLIHPHFTRARTSHASHPLAPLRPSRTLIRALFADSVSGTHLTLADVARARVRRSATSGPIPVHLQQFADAECALAIAVMGGDVHSDAPSVPLDVLREWLEEERLPTGWKPGGVMGFWRNHLNTAKVQDMMAKMKKYRENRGEVRTVVHE